MNGEYPSIETWDKVANTYNTFISDAEYELANDIENIISGLGINKGGRIIELGSGSGHLSAILSKQGYDVTLLDFSPVALNKAKDTFKHMGLQGEFIECDLLNGDIPRDVEYDVAWNSGVMEHFNEENLLKALNQISHIKARYYVFIVPNASSMPYLLFRFKKMVNGEWLWGKEYLRKNYPEFLFKQNYKLISEDYLGESLTEGHVNYVLGEEYSLPFQYLVKNKIFSRRENYLKAYIASLSEDELGNYEKSNFHENVDLDYWKTEVFDLLSESRFNKNKFENAQHDLMIVKENNERLSIEKTAFKEERIEFEKIVEYYKSNINELIEQKDRLILSHEEEIREAENKIKLIVEEKKNISEQYKKEITSSLNGYVKKLDAVKEQIQKVANTRPYRLAYFIRRTKFQFLKGSKIDKAKFINWMFSKLKRKQAKPDSEYNPLFSISSTIKEFDKIVSNEYASYLEQPDVKSLKNGKNVYIFSGIPYYDIGGGQRGAQLAKIFDKMGYRVYYLYAYEASDGSNQSNIFIPAAKHASIDNYSIDEAINSLSAENIFIFEAPLKKFEPYLNLALKYNVPAVYEHIDNWDTSLGEEFYNEESFNKFLVNSSLIVATSRLLQKKLEEYIKTKLPFEKTSQVYYSSNAVDSDMFEYLINYEKPNDLKKGKKTILYYGSLWGEWFDWEILMFLANKRSDYQINLIGDYESVVLSGKVFPDNINFLGLKKQTELPAYLEHSDVAIIPFKNDEIGKYVSPLKVFEYISMGKKVVSTLLPDIQGYPNVYCSDNKEDWIKLIDSETPIEDFSTFVLENNWYSRCRFIIENCNISRQEKRISVIVLNRNNKKTITRCINSLLHYNSYNYEVIVVDNQSTDGSLQEIENMYKGKINLIKNEKNGCSSGRNLGVSNSLGELILFLDSDQWVVENKWLDNAIEILNDRKDIGAVGWAAGWFNENSVDGPIVDYYENRAIKSTEMYRTDITYLGTGGMLISKSLFERIGGFDEFYDPTCFEDTDLSMKIKNEGFKLAYCPYISIFHLPHQTTNSGSAEHRERMNRNGRYFMDKWAKINPHVLK